MKIVTKYALAGASLVAVYAYACANPLEIGDDVITVDPNSVLGDGGLPLGGSAGLGGAAGETSSGGSGGVTAGTGGTGGTGAGTGGSASGSGGTGGGVGGSAGAAGSGGAAQGGTGGAAAGSGGTAGSAGSAGTGNAGELSAENCDFDDPTGCEDLDCTVACPDNDGNCDTRCPVIVACVSGDIDCVTADDPLCGVRIGQNQAENVCTVPVQEAGGPNATQPDQPAFIARNYVECICTLPRP